MSTALRPRRRQRAARHNLALAGYPGFTTWTAQEWRQRVSGSRNFAPQSTWLARDDDGRIGAYLIAMEYDGHTEVTGRRELYVARLGSLPDRRGLGLGTALLTHAMHEGAAAGYATAALDVDSHDPSGALGIYERAGFTVRVSWRSMRAIVPAAATMASVPE